MIGTEAICSVLFCSITPIMVFCNKFCKRPNKYLEINLQNLSYTHLKLAHMALPDAQAQRTNICMEYGHAAKIYKTMVTRQLVTGNYESFAM